MGVIGSINEAQVNLTDSQLIGTAFFAKSLYSAVENEGNVKVLVQRTGSTSVAATAQLTFIDGTANGGVDFTNTPITVTFPAGATVAAAEQEVNIPITTNTSPGDNRSFYIELKDPSVGTTLRTWSTAKVRILDKDESTVCDATQTATFGGGTGGLIDPYRICSLPQLYLVRSNLTSHFRLMADLDLDPSFEANPSFPGTAYTQIASNFSGSFNGDEHILKNFRVTNSAGSGIAVALFNDVGGNTDVAINGVNLVQTRNLSTGSDLSNAGLVGRVTGPINTLSNNHVSGLIKTTGTTSANSGGLINRTLNTSVSPFIRNFVHGHVVSRFAAGGIMAGIFDNWSNATANLTAAYSTASVYGRRGSGGLVGFIDRIRQGFVNIVNSHAKSFVDGDQDSNEANFGGLVGLLGCNSNSVMEISNSSYSGPLLGSGSRAARGGLVGLLWVHDTCAMTLDSVTGTIAMNVTSDGSSGGLFGHIDFARTFSLTNMHSYGSIHSTYRYGAIGGIAGKITATGSDDVLTITNANSSINITGTADVIDTRVGGIIGHTVLSQNPMGATGDTLSLYSSYFDGNVTEVGGFAGGIIGGVDMSDGSHTMNLTDLENRGNISSFRNTGGIIGNATLSTGDALVLRMTRTNSIGSTIQSAINSGGIIGVIDSNGTGTTNFTIAESYSTSNVTGIQSGGGIVGSFMPYYGGGNFRFTEVHATGIISGPVGGSRIGGIFGNVDIIGTGSQSIILDTVYATGEVSGERAGGVIGVYYSQNPSCSFSILNTYTQGAVSGTSHAGGLIGDLQLEPSALMTLDQNYTRSLISGAGLNGGLFGQRGSHAPAMTNTFWLQDGVLNAGINSDSGSNYNSTVYLKTVAELQTPATYSGWATFSTYWNSPSAGIYPSLK